MEGGREEKRPEGGGEEKEGEKAGRRGRGEGRQETKMNLRRDTES